MVTAARLVTLVDVGDRVDDPGGLSLSARHEAVLEDGRRVPLLDDRGCTTSPELGMADRPEADSSRQGRPDRSAVWSVEAIEETARVVVGPDEPPPVACGRTWRQTIGPACVACFAGTRWSSTQWT
jgi:hypothetical protein